MAVRSASPFSKGGVPTQINMAWLRAIASGVEVNKSLPPCRFFCTSASRWGSKKRKHPRFQRFQLMGVAFRTSHLVTNLSQTGGGCESDVARSNHSNLHHGIP